MRTKSIIFAGILSGLAASAAAQTAGWQSVQGVLRDNNDILLSGNYDLEFRIYDAQTNGTLVDMDGDGTLEDPGDDVKTVSGLAINQGVFNTKFGPVAAKAFDGNPRWLQISIRPTGAGVFTALSRVELVTAPASADRLTRPATGSTALVTDSTGNVGVGVNSPGFRFHVQESTTSTIAGFNSTFPVGTVAFGNSVSSVGWNLGVGTGPAGNQDLWFGDPSFARLLIQKGTGNVGIGTATPAVKLTVDGGALGPAQGDALPLQLWTLSTPPNQQYVSIFANRSSPGSTWDTSDVYFRRQVDGTSQGFLKFTAQDVALGTWPNEALRASASGNVGIGTATPGMSLEVTRPSYYGVPCLGVAHTSSYLYMVADDISNPTFIWKSPYSLRFGTEPGRGAGYTEKMRILANGNVGIGTSTPNAKLEVAGNIIVAGCTGCASDARFKKNIHHLSSALSKLLALRGVSFNWKNPAEHGDATGPQLGFIAQEVEKVLPEWVLKGKDGYRYLNTNGFPALAVEAIRDQQGQIDQLRAENDRLREELSGLGNRLAVLESTVAKSATSQEK